MLAKSESSSDDLGDAEEGRLGIGRLLQYFSCDVTAYVGVVAARGVWFILSLLLRAKGSLVAGEDLGHRLNFAGVKFVEFADVFEDFVELRAIGFELGLGEIEVGKFSDAQDVFAGDFHGYRLWALVARGIKF